MASPAKFPNKIEIFRDGGPSRPRGLSPYSTSELGTEYGMLPLPRKRPGRKRRGPHPYRALSAAFCRNVGEAGRYCDGNGLYLHVEISGSRRWVQRLVIRGKPCTLGLGSYRLVSLADARELALANRKVARSGGDPLAERRQADGVPTFAEAVEKVIAIHSGIWRHPEKTKQQWRGCLRDHAYTRIGDKGVDKVTTADVMAVLLPLWTRRQATARKLRQRIGAVMKWAVAQGYRTDNPTGEAITAALPKRASQVRHMPALPHGEVAGAVEAVRTSSAWGRHEAVLRVHGVDRGQARGSARGVVGGDRPRRVGLDDPGDEDEDESRAPGPAVRSCSRGPACRSTTAQGLDYDPVRQAGLSQRPRQAARRRQAVEAARAVGDRGRSAWLPVVLPGLGVRADGSPAGGGGGCARPRSAQPDRSGVCEERPVRPPAAAHGRLDAIPRPRALTPTYRCVTPAGGCAHVPPRRLRWRPARVPYRNDGEQRHTQAPDRAHAS